MFSRQKFFIAFLESWYLKTSTIAKKKVWCGFRKKVIDQNDCVALLWGPVGCFIGFCTYVQSECTFFRLVFGGESIAVVLCGHIGLWTGLLAKCDHLRMSIRSQIIGSCDLPERLKCVSGMSDAREEVSEAKFR